MLMRHQTQLRPLQVLLTRPLDQSKQTAEWIESEGGIAHIFPCLVVLPTDPLPLQQALVDVSRHSAVAVTSVHAARALIAHWPTEKKLPPLFVLGNKTAQTLAKAGLVPTEIVDGETATARQLAKRLLAAIPATDKPVLFPQAETGREELPLLLAAARRNVEKIAVYQTVPATKEALLPAVQLLRERRIDLWPVGSPKTAQVLLDVLSDEAASLLAGVCVGAIGQTTAQALRDRNLRVDVVAEQPEFEDLLIRLAEAAARRE